MRHAEKNYTGDAIRRARKYWGFTQKDLAERLGVTSTTIKNYEKGLRFPELSTIYKISEILKISVFALLPPPVLTIEGYVKTFMNCEEDLGLHPEIHDGKVSLSFDLDDVDMHEKKYTYPNMLQYLSDWATMYRKYKDKEITKEQYTLWKQQYPAYENELTNKYLDKEKEEALFKALETDMSVYMANQEAYENVNPKAFKTLYKK